ncbi:MAG TPA: hypothetical protein VG916_09315 [Gemmatimonadaceae bacterium]|nr:hypothetical protein [Gemmatimonadaceae bacterium]
MDNLPVDKPVVDANDIRWNGEHADGIRDETLYVVRAGDNAINLMREDEYNALPADTRPEILYFALTRSTGTGGMRAVLGQDVTIQLKLGGRFATKVITLPEADAVFISQSAVEKFMLPYYTRFKSTGQVDAIRQSLYNAPDVIAVEHIPPSIKHAITARGVKAGDEREGSVNLQV